MTECFAIALDFDGYQFTPHEKGDIHVSELTDVAQIRSVNIDESEAAKSVLAAVGIEDYVVKSPANETGEIGMPVEHLDRFLDGADRSPHTVTVAADVKRYIQATPA